MSNLLNRIVLSLAVSMMASGLPTITFAQAAQRDGPVRLALLQASGDSYTVQRGDTLYGISRRLGVSPEALAEANDLGSGTRINPGMKLRAPGPQGQTQPSPTAQAAGRVVTVSGEASTYVVRRGDTVDAIAARLGMTRKAFADLNDLAPPYALSVGRKLKGPPEGRKVYVVSEGDNLEGVARRFSVTVRQLASANDIRPSSSLRSGQRLSLPEGFRDRGVLRITRRSERSPAVAIPQGTSLSARTGTQRPPQLDGDVGAVTTQTLASGRVISVKGRAATYKVRKGDTVDGIADKLGLSRRELASLNGLKPPYSLRPGQVLKGPARTERAYVTVAGDTLSVVSRRFGVTPRALATANGLRSTAPLRAGQKLILPNGARDRGPIRETLRVTPSPTILGRPLAEESGQVAPETDAPLEDPSSSAPPELRPVPSQGPAVRPTSPTVVSDTARPSPPVAGSTARTEPRQETGPVQATSRPQAPTVAAPPSAAPAPRPSSGGFTPPPTTSTTPLTDAQITALGKGRFLWPLRGEVLSDFGPKGTGQRNDGINIRAQRGAPVRASAAGEVVYAGDQVPGFGNLVLIKHPDGWVTAYAHLSNVGVRIQQKVLQGQQIGEAGDTGGVPEPQLHFEIRYTPTPTERARPVSPTLLLPR